jgi:hypothetical protein
MVIRVVEIEVVCVFLGLCVCHAVRLVWPRPTTPRRIHWPVSARRNELTVCISVSNGIVRYAAPLATMLGPCED